MDSNEALLSGGLRRPALSAECASGLRRNACHGYSAEFPSDQHPSKLSKKRKSLAPPISEHEENARSMSVAADGCHARALSRGQTGYKSPSYLTTFRKMEVFGVVHPSGVCARPQTNDMPRSTRAAPERPVPQSSASAQKQLYIWRRLSEGATPYLRIRSNKLKRSETCEGETTKRETHNSSSKHGLTSTKAPENDRTHKI